MPFIRPDRLAFAGWPRHLSRVEAARRVGNFAAGHPRSSGNTSRPAARPELPVSFPAIFNLGRSLCLTPCDSFGLLYLCLRNVIKYTLRAIDWVYRRQNKSNTAFVNVNPGPADCVKETEENLSVYADLRK